MTAEVISLLAWRLHKSLALIKGDWRSGPLPTDRCQVCSAEVVAASMHDGKCKECHALDAFAE